WINVKPVIELKRRLIALHNPLRFRRLVGTESVIEPVEYTIGPQIVVLKDDFVGVGVVCDRAVGRSRVTNRAHRDTRSSRSGGFGFSLLLLRIRKISDSLLQ